MQRGYARPREPNAREAEESRLGGLDEVAEERVREAEAALWVFGCGLMAALPRG